MPKSPDSSTVSVAGGQTKLTVPKPLAEAAGLRAGQKVKWRVKGRNRLEVVFGVDGVQK